mmetsp:Transcript_31030/g.93196  ORF Transcript_31030/g.93196 Transcript_31030/m.93196 type:complete len:82 (-) Transcript_31030:16-261(-)
MDLCGSSVSTTSCAALLPGVDMLLQHSLPECGAEFKARLQDCGRDSALQSRSKLAAGDSLLCALFHMIRIKLRFNDVRVAG